MVTKPRLFEHRLSDNSTFRCSETFVRKYLHGIGWSERRGTRAAQKLPANIEEVLMDAFFRESYTICKHKIKPELEVNTDQTQLNYQHGTKQTWNEKGAKNVSILGIDEKRAFTLVPSISASGELLPFQAVFEGSSKRSLPSPKSRLYDEAMKRGFKFVPSGTKTYWSNLNTMKSLVNDIIAPYFNAKRKDLGLPSTQKALWKIDCWSVHKSEEFRTWMKKTHPNIIIIYVPGGCTGLWQPLDVAIQRPLKLSLKRSGHLDMVNEVTEQLTQPEVDPRTVKVDTTVGVLRDRSVAWLVNAYDAINNKCLILKVGNHSPRGLSDCCIGI